MNRRGSSLLVVLLSILLLSTAASLVYWRVVLGLREGRTNLASGTASQAAEAESERLLALWKDLGADTLAIGVARALPGVSPVGRLTLSDSIWRLGEALFLLRVVAERGTAEGGRLARDGVARVIELRRPSIPDSQALLTLGPVVIAESALVDGADHAGAGAAGCGPASSAGAGILAAPSPTIALSCAGGTCLQGAPPLLVDSTVGAPAIERLGSVPLSEMISTADIAVSGDLPAVGPRSDVLDCDRREPSNWGDPFGVVPACAGYFPVIVAAPGTRVGGGSGQGLLIGLGGLELAGDLVFQGVVLSRGPLALRGRARIIGTVLAGDSVAVLDLADLDRSTCSTRAALSGAKWDVKAAPHGWMRWP
jgi:hypothetical protein